MPANEIRDVGFIGLADEGAAIALAIAANGYRLHVSAGYPDELHAVASVPHTTHGSVAELARASDAVGLFRNDADNVRIAVEKGLLAALRPGGVLVNFANGLPAEARHLAELAAPYGVTFLDVPVSGGPAAAEARQLTALAGGDATVVKLLTPLFTTFATSVVHLGPVGSGEYGKLFGNALMAMNHQNVLDVLRLALSLELPIPALLDVLRSGSASSFALAAIGPVLTMDNVGHLKPLELEDMRLFGGALEPLGEQARPIVERAVDGARQLDELTALVIGAQPAGRRS